MEGQYPCVNRLFKFSIILSDVFETPLHTAGQHAIVAAVDNACPFFNKLKSFWGK